MGIKKINEWEKAVVFLLNLDGWELEHCGDGYSRYDAKGKTPKGKDCVIEMKFRNKYYEDKLIEKDKYDSLMALDVVKLFFVNDPKGNFMYWLDTLEMPKPVKKYCPDTTMWTKKRLLKDVYLLKENQAVRININYSPNQLLNFLFIIQINVYCAMIVNEAAWEKLKKQIEFHTEQDSEITDVQINYQVKEKKNKNYLKLNITIDKWDKITE